MNRDNDKGKILIGRTLVWVGVQFAMLLLIIVRLYYLQVYQADKFSTMADENRISTRLLIPPPTAPPPIPPLPRPPTASWKC